MTLPDSRQVAVDTPRAIPSDGAPDGLSSALGSWGGPDDESMPRVDPWSLYDALLAELKEDARVEACLVTKARTLVRSPWGVGMASTIPSEQEAYWEPEQEAFGGRHPLAGLTLSSLAAGLKSWNSDEACLGLAALNSYLNSPAQVRGWVRGSLLGEQSPSVFSTLLGEIKGQRVAVVGHFFGLEALAERCRLSILEKRPQPGDLPEQAAEYILPQQDYVFITGTALTNKTLPRLLDLSAEARVILVGPSVPLTPLWFDWGVDVLAGTVVTDGELAWQAATQWTGSPTLERGDMKVELRREDVVKAESMERDLMASDQRGGPRCLSISP